MRVRSVVKKRTNYLTNQNMKTTKRSYNAPEIQEFEINTEGIICVSNQLEQNVIDAGILEENEW